MSSNPSIKWDAPKCAPYVKRGCRAWPAARRVPVPAPGVRRAESQEQGQGVVVRRGLEEVQGHIAGGGLNENQPFQLGRWLRSRRFGGTRYR
jgi:hypothetical protein